MFLQAQNISNSCQWFTLQTFRNPTQDAKKVIWEDCRVRLEPSLVSLPARHAILTAKAKWVQHAWIIVGGGGI